MVARTCAGAVALFQQASERIQTNKSTTDGRGNNFESADALREPTTTKTDTATTTAGDAAAESLGVGLW